MLKGFVDFRCDGVEECRNGLNYILFWVVFIIFLFGVGIVFFLTVRRDS